MDAAGHSAEHERLSALFMLSENEECIIVTSVEACMQYTLPPEILKENIIKINTGDTFDIRELSENDIIQRKR